MDTKPHDQYLVLGGSGLLGRYIVEQLAGRGENVSVFDLVQRYDDVPFYSGDIAEEDSVVLAIQKCGATCVFHTASPHATSASPESFWKVNVDGTRAVISACLAAGVHKLVYTGSSGVVFGGSDINGVDETCAYTTKNMGPYNETKIIAEKCILAANGKQGLLTTVLRPSGIFGPGDRQLINGMWNTYNMGRTNVQIGDNNNLTDWTYVSNVADAHILAADKLSAKADPPVAGEIFFITNDDPIPFWDFANGIWDRLDKVYPGKRVKKKPLVIPRSLAWIMAVISEFLAWVSRKRPVFTRFNVVFTCTARWHNVEKAKRALGYKPKVSLSEGLDLFVNWWTEQQAQEQRN